MIGLILVGRAAKGNGLSMGIGHPSTSTTCKELVDAIGWIRYQLFNDGVQEPDPISICFFPSLFLPSAGIALYYLPSSPPYHSSVAQPIFSASTIAFIPPNLNNERVSFSTITTSVSISSTSGEVDKSPHYLLTLVTAETNAFPELATLT